MSSSLERVWLERATLEAVKSDAWSLMSSAILCKGLRHELCIYKKRKELEAAVLDHNEYIIFSELAGKFLLFAKGILRQGLQ